MVVSSKISRKKQPKSPSKPVEVIKAKKKSPKSETTKSMQKKTSPKKSKVDKTKPLLKKKHFVTPPSDNEESEEEPQLKRKQPKKNLVLAPPADVEKIAKNANKPEKLKAKKQKKTVSKTVEEIDGLEPEDEDEDIKELQKKYNLNVTELKKAIQGVIKFRQENPKIKNELFSEQFNLSLKINSILVPKTHNHIVRIPLKHAIYGPDSDICLIVSELKGVPNKDHEKHIQHYEELLSKAGINNIKKIMTFHEFRTEYETFEMKRRLAGLYDLFLSDGKISGKVVQKMGRIFYNAKKIPTAINIIPNKLKHLVEMALCKTPLYLHGNGDTFQVDIGNNGMSAGQLARNILYVFKGLDEHFPGGVGNLRAVSVSAFRATNIPIYTSLKNKKDVVMEEPAKKNSKRFEEVTGELTTKLNTHVKVAPDGTVTTVHVVNGRVINGKQKSEAEVEEQEEENKEEVVEDVKNVKKEKKVKKNNKQEEKDVKNVEDVKEKKDKKLKTKKGEEIKKNVKANKKNVENKKNIKSEEPPKKKKKKVA